MTPEYAHRLSIRLIKRLDEVPCQWVSYDCAMDQRWKMTTVNGGKSIKLTFDDGDYIIVGEDG